MPDAPPLYTPEELAPAVVAASEAARAALVGKCLAAKLFRVRGYDVEVAVRPLPDGDPRRTALKRHWHVLVRIDTTKAKGLKLAHTVDDLSWVLQRIETAVVDALFTPEGPHNPREVDCHHDTTPDQDKAFPAHHRTLGRFRAALYTLGPKWGGA